MGVVELQPLFGPHQEPTFGRDEGARAGAEGDRLHVAQGRGEAAKLAPTGPLEGDPHAVGGSGHADRGARHEPARARARVTREGEPGLGARLGRGGEGLSTLEVESHGAPCPRERDHAGRLI